MWFYQQIIIDQSIKLIKFINKKDLETEIEKMWHLKTTTMPVIEVVLGKIQKGSDKHIKEIPGSPWRTKKNSLLNCSSPYETTINGIEKYLTN